MVTDQQVRRLRRLDLCGLSKERVADKAGVDAKTARKYRRLGKLPSEVRRMERDYRTRNDPFAEVWPQLETQLQLNPGLEAKTLFADLQRRANENGDGGQSHRQFKRALDQALLLRGGRDFASREEYAAFVHRLFAQGNCGRRQRLAEELPLLRPLPSRRLESCQRVWVRVDRGSTIHVRGNTYSVCSRLIGERVEARLYAERVEVWYGQRLLESLPRLRGRGKHKIAYRHVIDWLVRKPGAFADYRYRQELFPSSRFRWAYDVLVERCPGRAVREYLAICTWRLGFRRAVWSRR